MIEIVSASGGKGERDFPQCFASKIAVLCTAVFEVFLRGFLGIFWWESVAESGDFIYNESGRVLDAKTKEALGREKEKRHA